MDSIVELINHPEQLNKDTLHELRELVARYPYTRQRPLLAKPLLATRSPLW